MKSFWNPAHQKHDPEWELDDGQFVTPYEMPSRVDMITKGLIDAGLDAPLPAKAANLEQVSQVHDHGYLEFLQTAWAEWHAMGRTTDVMANISPVRGFNQTRVPVSLDAKVGFYCLAMETSITKTTWQAALGSAGTALAATHAVLKGDASAFALCRPPGHHATADQFGGYCFLNNAAIAAQHARTQGANRVAILDVDFHHGNGTQSIFYDREDVFFCSLHGHPDHEFPYYLGWGDETGTGAGLGHTLNIPFKPQTNWATWSAGLKTAMDAINKADVDLLIVSLGVDTYKDDPISSFTLDHDDFTSMGRLIAQMNLPTVFVMEGGYAVEQIGINTANTLVGFNTQRAD